MKNIITIISIILMIGGNIAMYLTIGTSLWITATVACWIGIILCVINLGDFL